jgi:hypothetical protein
MRGSSLALAMPKPHENKAGQLTARMFCITARPLVGAQTTERSELFSPPKGTAYLAAASIRPYLKCDAMNPALAAEGNSQRSFVSVL